VRRGPIETLNRPRGRIFDLLRIERPAIAYATCCLIAAMTGATAAAILFTYAMRGFPDLRTLLLLWLVWTTVVTILAGLLAWPFAFSATRAGQMYGIENAAYYNGLGALAGPMSGALFLMALKVRHPATQVSRFDATMLIASALYGAVWATGWWYLHRRWKTEPAG
jgi:uncharacterized membrane protein YidH (DUF202 family)